jgi:hypothetical protein
MTKNVRDDHEQIENSIAIGSGSRQLCSCLADPKKDKSTNLHFINQLRGSIIQVRLLHSELVQVKLFSLGIVFPG